MASPRTATKDPNGTPAAASTSKSGLPLTFPGTYTHGQAVDLRRGECEPGQSWWCRHAHRGDVVLPCPTAAVTSKPGSLKGSSPWTPGCCRGSSCGSVVTSRSRCRFASDAPFAATFALRTHPHGKQADSRLMVLRRRSVTGGLHPPDLTGDVQRVGSAHAGGVDGVLQPDELPLRLGLAARHRNRRGRPHALWLRRGRSAHRAGAARRGGSGRRPALRAVHRAGTG